jgi:hypothetical protein
MPQVEKLKIFLASPSDVATERRHVEKVVEVINRTVATAQGVELEVISSKNAFPGYGKDGQAILNDQIGKMREYELFLGIMWNRIGTPTPRAISGTAEEFTRAVRALMRKGKPLVWFYFRQWPAHLTTKGELEQREEVLKFRDKFQGKGLFRDYTTPVNFRDQFQEHLILWLNERRSIVSPPRAAKSRSKKTSAVKTKSESSIAASDRKKTTSAATAKGDTATKPSTTPRKTPTSKSRTTRSAEIVKNPENWVMLNEKFFQTESSATQPDRSIILRLSPKDMEQVAELKSLHPGEFHNRKQIAYADQHDAGIMEVSSVLPESVAGKASFNITLTPIQRSQNSSFVMEANSSNYSADEIAQLRARLILLGEALPKDLGRFFSNTQITGPYNHTVAVEKGIFPELWAKLQTQPRLFLPKAWLWAVYYLKMSQLVEDVLELELGPIKNKVMPVRFRGRRRVYANQEPSIIKVVGNCSLSA